MRPSKHVGRSITPWTVSLATVALVATLVTSLALAHPETYIAVGAYHIVNPPEDCLGNAPVSTPAFNIVCFPGGHVEPNANGEATFFARDSLQTNVGFVVCQDTNRDGNPCAGGDWSLRGCNSVTVNSGWGWNPGLTTYVIIDSFIAGSAALNPWPSCGPGVDSFGTTGEVNHS